MEGTVYKDRELPVDPADRLNRTCHVTIKKGTSALGTAGWVLAMSIKVAVDGILILFGTTLLSFGRRGD